MKRLVWTIGVFAAVAVVAPRPSAAQGVTTAAIAGVVTDSAGAPLTGATVVAVHGPSGTQYSAVTRADAGRIACVPASWATARRCKTG